MIFTGQHIRQRVVLRGTLGYRAKLALLIRDRIVIITIVNISETLADALISSIAGYCPVLSYAASLVPLTQHKTNHRSHKQTENPAE